VSFSFPIPSPTRLGDPLQPITALVAGGMDALLLARSEFSARNEYRRQNIADHFLFLLTSSAA
jgi:hypothetical protein